MSFHAVSIPGTAVLQGGNITVTQLVCSGAMSRSYQTTATPTTLFSISFPSNKEALIFTPAGPSAGGTVTMPASPLDGQLARFATNTTLSAFTVLAGPGQQITGAPVGTPFGITGGHCFTFVSGTTAWVHTD